MYFVLSCCFVVWSKWRMTKLAAILRRSLCLENQTASEVPEGMSHAENRCRVTTGDSNIDCGCDKTRLTPNVQVLVRHDGINYCLMKTTILLRTLY